MNDSLPSDIANKKMVAGVCAILLGWLGVHKFVLGMTTPGIIMVCISVFSCGTISSIIGLIEGIIYLTKSDAEFYQTYMVEKKA